MHLQAIEHCTAEPITRTIGIDLRVGSQEERGSAEESRWSLSARQAEAELPLHLGPVAPIAAVAFGTGTSPPAPECVSNRCMPMLLARRALLGAALLAAALRVSLVAFVASTEAQEPVMPHRGHSAQLAYIFYLGICR
jgi:hypothetical protein